MRQGGYYHGKHRKRKSEHIFGGGGYCLAEETWKKAWSEETHITEFAEKRIKSAKSAKMTPIKIDTEDLYGYFQGSHGRYETFLDTCPCGDFKRYNLPCKHIYRLAIELGLMNEKAETNSNAIPTPRKEKATLDEEIDIIETLSEQAQKKLKDIAEKVTSKNPDVHISKNKVIDELLESGIIEESGKTSVTIPTQYTPRHIHFYLHRKLDNESFYDFENGVMVVCETRLLDTVLPDDKITDQLIKRGYYKK